MSSISFWLWRREGASGWDSPSTRAWVKMWREALGAIGPRGVGRAFALDGGVDEDVARGLRVDRAEVDGALGDDREAVKRDLFVGDDVGGRRVPVGVGVGALDEVVSEVLDPLGLDLRDGARVELRRLDELGGHDPLGLALELGGAGEDVHLGPAGAGVLVGLSLVGDVAEEAGEEGAVDGVVAGGVATA